MLTYTQQLKIVYNVFTNFNQDKITEHFVPDDYKNNTKFLYNPKKFERMTLANFKIMIIYVCYYLPEGNSNVRDILATISDFTKHDFNTANKLRTDVITYRYIIRTDENIIETYTDTPYGLMKQNKIHPFTFAWYYKRNPQKIQEFSKHDIRIVQRYYNRARILTDYFKLDEE